METLSSMARFCAAAVGAIVGLVTWRMFSREMGNCWSLALGACAGTLSGIGLSTLGEDAVHALLIPWEALGIAVVLIFLLKPFLKDRQSKKEGKGSKSLPPESGRATDLPEDDPWIQEIRRNGKLAAGRKRKC
jgi:UDP-N-acetylmuramyl pentapeptide phosphotransferase/UDP-N-acetylglucosamine-1-phosphate transferase